MPESIPFNIPMIDLCDETHRHVIIAQAICRVGTAHQPFSSASNWAFTRIHTVMLVNSNQKDYDADYSISSN